MGTFIPGKLPRVLYSTLAFLTLIAYNTYAQDECQTGADCICSECRVGICLVNSSTGFTECSCMPQPNGASCDDGIYCNGNDTCINGTCDHSGNPCHPQVCVEEWNGACASACSVDEDCVDEGWGCIITFCTDAGYCDEAPTTGPCDDGIYCNGNDTCTGDGEGCAIHSGNPCPSGTSCNEATDSCEQLPGATTTTSTTPQPTTTTTSTIELICPPDYPIDCGNDYCCPVTHPICGYGLDVGSCFSRRGLCLLEVLYKEDTEQVQLLRDFRDNVLNRTQEGQQLIRLYYEWSPVIVNAIEADENFKQEIKDLIDEILPMLSH